MRKHFYGYEISAYGLENGFVDYHTFARALGNVVLCNEIPKLLTKTGSDIILNNYDYEAETPTEIYQFYIIDSTESNFDLLKEAGEIYFYEPEYDILVWCITHYGTSWDYVLTNIEIKGE